MVDIAVLGTIGLDTLKTPFGKVADTLGGSAVYAAYAASFFAKPGIISVKGSDLSENRLDFLKEKGISLEGVKTEGKNFRWSGEYEFDMNEAKTLKTELNSLENFNPKVPESYKKAKYLFLANVDPEIQLKTINSMNSPELIIMDTMNLWIENKKKELLETVKKSDILILNDAEARQLFETPNLVKAGKKGLSIGPEAVIIKKGEHGSLLFTDSSVFSCPGYPLENLVDPTGCGDSFGGALIGHYSKTGNIRKAMVYGAVIASFNAEDFGLNSLKKVTEENIEERFKELAALSKF
ncbi:sugar kinase [Candidatus Woesearchaeota archaeon]|nr:sugar kinase [Candidatus Woesearchaeota archaeon]